MRTHLAQILFLATIFIAVLCSADAQAQTSVEKMNAKTSKVSGKISLENSRNLYKDNAKTNSSDLSINPKVDLGGDISVSALAVISKDHLGPQDTTLANTAVVLTKKYQVGSFAWSPGVVGDLPTNEQDRFHKKYKGGLGLRSALSREGFGSVPLDATWSISAMRFFNEFNLDAQGNPLLESSLKNRLTLEYHFTKMLSVSTLSDYVVGRTYGGFVHTKFANAADLNVAFNATWTASLGLSTEGEALKYDGVESNISFFNDNTSVIKVGVTYVF